MRIKNILFSTDFSPISKGALFYTLHLASAMKADLVLFHAYRVPIPTTDLPLEIIEQQARITEGEIRSSYSELASDAKKYDPSIGLKFLMKPGYLETYVKEIIQEEDIDLIVMHTKGINLLQSLLLGSNAAQVLEKAACPVLVLPDNYKFKPYKHVLFSSLYLDSDIESLEYLSEFISLFNSEIIVVNIYNENESVETEFNVTRMFEELVKKRVSYPKLKFSCLKGENVIETIDAYTSEHPTDLLVMTTRHRGVFEKIYDRSMTKMMSYHIHIPLLVFHSQDEFE